MRSKLTDNDEFQCPHCKKLEQSPDLLVPNKTLRASIERFKRTGHERVAEQPPPQQPQLQPQPQPQPQQPQQPQQQPQPPPRASVNPVAAVPPKPQPQPPQPQPQPQLGSQPRSVSISASLGSTSAVDANRAPQSTAPDSTDRMPVGAPPKAAAARSVAVKPVAGGIDDIIAQAHAESEQQAGAGSNPAVQAPLQCQFPIY